MLELKHIKKEYRSKKGGNTLAVNDISLVFENTGMTFLLGKSGSGKSTLLNIIGGLDRYDSGEITILGKSSSNFTKEDFDSYRNTYVGFIFQEFHVLEDYTVYENIILALQLQKKEVDHQKIQSLLSKLELSELKDRKINELSGGQKQRVAIARALIKDPKIILADEPTGNLDSKTSRQVLDLLKQISKEKLVIIVSHDEESAQEYADRIIEIRDGAVIRDTKEITEVPQISEKFQLIRSKLPTKESFRLGVGSLKHKKIRLCATIFLTACALFFLGMSDTMASFQMAKAHAKLMVENEKNLVSIQHIDPSSTSWYSINLPWQQKDIDAVKDQIPEFISSYRISLDQTELQYTSLGINQPTNSMEDNYYTVGAYTQMQVVPLPENQTWIKENVIGHLPQNEDEIVISNYVSSIIQKYGIQPYTENELDLTDVYYPANDQELVEKGLYINFNGIKKVKIVGVIQYDLSKYETIKKTIDKTTYLLYNDLSSEVKATYNRIYVAEDFFQYLNIPDTPMVNMNYIYDLSLEDGTGLYANINYSNKPLTYFDGTNYQTIDKLNDHQILLSPEDIAMLYSDNSYEAALEEYLSKQPEDADLEAMEKSYFEHFVSQYRQLIGEKVRFCVKGMNDKNLTEEKKLEIIGVVPLDKQNGRIYTYVSEQNVEQFKTYPIERNELLFHCSDQKELQQLFTEFAPGGEYQATTVYSSDLVNMNEFFNLAKKVAFYISLVFAVFALILITNFIFSSIAYRKKEIGILRALGARGMDVFKIFMWEGFFLALISGILASIGTGVVCAVLNPMIINTIGIGLTPLMFGIRQIGLIFVIVFVITIIASLLPIRKISKMKPIDAILKR
ncbi:MAG: hypothetical protein DBX37_03800 [Massilioclostridium sp.]|nr:MAG: hypothetical protein DBX37_03800 [Massilioclostridium sp.]